MDIDESMDAILIEGKGMNGYKAIKCENYDHIDCLKACDYLECSNFKPIKSNHLDYYNRVMLRVK